METIDLLAFSRALPAAWRSEIIGRVGPARIKAVRMDGRALPQEMHNHDEALLVIEGCMELTTAGTTRTVHAGELVLMKAQTPHAVAAGSSGVLLIVDL